MDEQDEEYLPDDLQFDLQDLLTVAEVCQALKISRSTPYIKPVDHSSILAPR